MVAIPGDHHSTLSGALPNGDAGFSPAYLALCRSGELAQRVRRAQAHLEDCDLCARYCHVNRRETVKGAVCRTGEQAIVYSYGPHKGEENCLRGRRGSGTIFFSWCNLRCDFCQNWEVSWQGEGRAVGSDELAAMMLDLQSRGCHNINFVSPSHVVAQILAAVAVAAEKGLHLPLVYNSGGYDSLEALALLDGVIDIYMPDMKYGSSDQARRYSHVRDYTGFNRATLLEMHRQVGDLAMDENGLARRGLLVRHLVLPEGIAGTKAVFRFLAEKVSPDTYVNVMDQYRPCFKAGGIAGLDRAVTSADYAEAMELARRFGLWRLDERARQRRPAAW